EDGRVTLRRRNRPTCRSRDGPPTTATDLAREAVPGRSTAPEERSRNRKRSSIDIAQETYSLVTPSLALNRRGFRTRVGEFFRCIEQMISMKKRGELRAEEHDYTRQIHPRQQRYARADRAIQQVIVEVGQQEGE